MNTKLMTAEMTLLHEVEQATMMQTTVTDADGSHDRAAETYLVSALVKAIEDRYNCSGFRYFQIEGDWVILAPLGLAGLGGGIAAIIRISDQTNPLDAPLVPAPLYSLPGDD